jgi:hypothetical protein
MAQDRPLGPMVEHWQYRNRKGDYKNGRHENRHKKRAGSEEPAPKLRPS